MCVYIYIYIYIYIYMEVSSVEELLWKPLAKMVRPYTRNKSMRPALNLRL